MQGSASDREAPTSFINRASNSLKPRWTCGSCCSSVSSAHSQTGEDAMTISPDAVEQMAQDYTAAWNSKSAEAVASFYAEDGEIVINRGEPWSG